MSEAPLHVVETSDAVAEAALPPAAPAKPRESITVPLTYPIQAHGQVYTELTLRPVRPGELIGRDIPFAPDMSRFNTTYCAQWIELLAGIPPSSVKQIDPGDFVIICDKMVPFFLPAKAS